MGYKLSDVVKEILIEMGDSNMNRYARAYQLATSCLRSLNMDLSGLPKIVSLTIKDNDTVDLPNDYLQYSKIAICGRDGQLHALGLNNNLCLNPNYDDCGDVTRHTSTNPTTGDSFIGWDYYSDHYRNGELMGRFFGIGGGNNANGSFRIDKANNQILLAGLNYRISEIVLEYISDINAVDEDYEVHPFIIETIKDYVYWMIIARNLKVGLGDKQLAEKKYWNSYRASKNRFASFTVDEFKEAIRTGNLGSPKF